MNYHMYLIFEIMAMLTAIFQYNKIKDTAYKAFIPYLLFIVFYEIGTICRLFGINHTNLWITNYNLFVSFLFFSIFILKLLKTEYFKKWIRRGIFLSIFLSIINNLFYQGFWKLDTITILIQFALLILITFLYFYELMNYVEGQLSVIRNPGFWLNTGLLFYCLGRFLFFSAFAYMAYKNNYQFSDLSDLISNFCNAILYSCLTISFLCFSKIKVV